MILWSVVIDLCSFIRDIDSLGRVCVRTHRGGERGRGSIVYLRFVRLYPALDVSRCTRIEIGKWVAEMAVRPAWCSTRVCANTSLYIVRLSTSQLTRRYWVTLYNSVYLILATKYYSRVSTTECLVWLLAIIVPVVSLVLGL